MGITQKTRNVQRRQRLPDRLLREGGRQLTKQVGSCSLDLGPRHEDSFTPYSGPERVAGSRLYRSFGSVLWRSHPLYDRFPGASLYMCGPHAIAACVVPPAPVSIASSSTSVPDIPRTSKEKKEEKIDGVQGATSRSSFCSYVIEKNNHPAN